ncbi:MAG: glycosyltransferase family 4 protein [Ginsengibacter sp.]
MNVLSIVPYKIFPASLGGQKGIALFNEYFSQYHHLICVTVKENDPSFAPYEVANILSNSRSRYINIFYFRVIKRLIKENNISHIILEHPYYGWLALLLKYVCKVKLIVHSHNIESERFRSTGKWWWKILWYYERFVHRKADFTFCITGEDREYFLKEYKIPLEKSSVITYGIDWRTSPGDDERGKAKNKLQKEYGLPINTLLFLFNGTLNYGPNLNAVKNIINYINPIFLKNEINYKIIICGKGLPQEMEELKGFSGKNIIYAGFVDDITIYFKGVDVFINPVTDGGGIKTKLVEALGYNLNTVSTVSGAMGVDENICNGKLFLCTDSDWQQFADSMLDASHESSSIPPSFFKHFYWGNIANKAAKIVDRGNDFVT